MKSFFQTAILAIFILASGLCASALDITPSSKYVTRKVTSGPFNAVRTNTAIDLIYTNGPQDITIYAPDNLMKYIKVSIKGKEIVVSYSENLSIKGKVNVQARISSPDVVQFTSGSSGDIIIKSNLERKGKEVQLIALSAGDIKASKIDAETVTLRTNSAGDIKTGDIKADYVNITTNSAGDIETGNIAAREKAEIKTNSAGDIELEQVYVGDKLSIAANSAGEIEIDDASAENITIHANSSGSIEIDKCKSTNLSAYCNSVGDVEIAGICENASLSTNSSGNIKARNLKATNITATVRSIGNVECHPLKSLTGNSPGNGKIRYAGKPSTISVTSSKNGVVPF